jgi:transcriptional pleiotropic regulator of transition state genes
VNKIVKVNSEGRVVIPAEMRKALNIKDEDEIEIELNGKIMSMKPKEKRCAICSRTDELNSTENLTLCNVCLTKLKTNFNLI